MPTSPPYQHHWQPLDSTRIPRVIYHSFWRQLVCPIIQVNDNILFQFARFGVCIILLDFLRSIYSKRNRSGDVYHFERRGFSQHVGIRSFGARKMMLMLFKVKSFLLVMVILFWQIDWDCYIFLLLELRRWYFHKVLVIALTPVN